MGAREWTDFTQKRLVGMVVAVDNDELGGCTGAQGYATLRTSPDPRRVRPDFSTEQGTAAEVAAG